MVSSAGDLEREFRDFVAARSTALLRTAYLLSGDWGAAEDPLQVTLTKTYLAWRRLDHIEAVEPYARRVLVNTATSWWRRRPRPAMPVWIDNMTFVVPEKDHILYVDVTDPAHPGQLPGPSTSERWLVVARVGG